MLKIALFCFRHGWERTGTAVFNLDLRLSGLAAAERRIRRARKRRAA